MSQAGGKVSLRQFCLQNFFLEIINLGGILQLSVDHAQFFQSFHAAVCSGLPGQHRMTAHYLPPPWSNLGRLG